MQYLKKEVRDRILNSAVEEFTKEGFADASIRNIADTAEISLGNIYRYFSNKEALYLAVINPFIDRVSAFIMKEGDLSADGLKNFPKSILNFYQDEYSCVNIVKKGNVSHYNQLIGRTVDAFSTKLREYVTDTHPYFAVKLEEKDFFNIVSSSYVFGLTQILNKERPYEDKLKDLSALTTFFFADIVERIKHVK